MATLGVVSAAVVLSVAAMLVGAATAVGQSQVTPTTAAERLGWARPTHHDEVMEFLAAVESASSHVEVRTLGESVEGRPLPVVFIGDPPISDPDASRASPKPTLLVLGSIHGDEPSGREASLQFIRELALGEERNLLETIDVIVLPNVNPDGSMSGTRGNADGYDLNRDWIVAETPEIGAILDEVVIPFRAEVFLDVHNGGAFPYHLTYQATLDPAADEDLVAFSRGAVFEGVRGHLEAREMSMYWYSGPSFDEEEDRWYWRTTEPWPRKQHSYGGLQDMLTLLFEVPDEHSLERGTEVARESMVGLARFMAAHPERVRGVVEGARRRTLEEPLERVHLELEVTPYPGTAEFLVMPRGFANEERAMGDASEARLVAGENRTRYRPARSRPAPWGYALDPGLDEAVALLRRHGVRVEEIPRPVTVRVERFRVLEINRSADRYQHHLLVDADVELEAGAITLPAGGFLVPLQQPAGRLIPQLLEPDAVDSLVRWNLLDAVLRGDEAYLPIHRLLERPDEASDLAP